MGTTPTLKFNVTADPSLVGDIRHTLTRDAEPAPGRFGVKEDSITFRKVTPADSGTYVIRCKNDDGEVGTASFYLDVTTPLPPTSKNVYPCNPFVDSIYNYTLL